MDVRDTLLLVKSSADRRALLRGVFEDNYNLLEAENGKQAMLLLEQNSSCVACVLLNVTLPDMSGFDVLQAMDIRHLLDDIPVVVITGNAEQDEARAFDLGASDVVVEPYDPFVLHRRVQTIVELNRHKWHLQDLVAEQEGILRRSNQVMVDALSSIIEYRSVESGQHILRIRRFTQILLEEIARSCPEYNLNDRIIGIISSAAALHDIGKISIPDSILNKPGRLTPEEMDVMRGHALTGCHILESLNDMGNEEYLRYAHNICHYHHERWDGSGYPEHIRGDAIPICAQVVGLADAYDALTSKRVYKEAYSLDRAMNMILNGECGMFSPKLLECFKQVSDQFAALALAYADGLPPKSDDITAPLPGPTPHKGLDTLEMTQLKYQTLLHYIDATVYEADLDNVMFHLIYNPDPNLLPLSTSHSISDAVTALTERIVVPEERQQALRFLQHDVFQFLEDGLRRHSYFFHVRSHIPGPPILYEVTLLRPDAGDLKRRTLIVIWEKARHHAIQTPEVPALSSLLPSELPFKAVYDSVAGLLCYANDQNFTLNYLGPGSLALLGYTEQELKDQFGGRMIDLVHPADRQMVRQTIAQQLNRGTQVEVENRLCHKDGRVIWVLNKSRLVVGRDGVEYLCGLLVDITNTKQAEEDLRLTLKRYQIIVSQTDNITFEWDMETDRIAYSDHWKTMFGYDPIAECVSSRIAVASHFHPEDLPNLMNRLQTLRSGVSDYEEVEVRIAKADGRYLWCRFRATAQRGADGSPVRAVGIIINIDQEKRAAKALQDKAEQDALTKLLNKDAGRRHAEEYLSSCRTGERCALLIVDMDNFKNVNDQFGHMFGDAVLSLVSDELRKLFRNNDIVARIGGDEFMVLMKDIPSLTLVQDRCAKLLNALNTSLQKNLPQCQLSCSVGIALYPEHGLGYQELFQRADRALYQAKGQGKGIYHCYDLNSSYPTLQSASITGTHIDSDVEPGMANDSLVHYAFHRLYESGDVEGTVNAILELVGRQMNVSRVYVFENDPDNTHCSNTFEWCNEGIPPEIHNLQHISYETDIPGYEDNFDERGIFYCPDIAQMPKAAYDILEPQGIKSMLQCAIRENGVFRGYVGFDECSTVRFWTQDQIDTLTFFSEILSVFLLKMRTQAEITRRTEDLTSVLDNQNAWIYVIDPDTCRLRFVNAKTHELAPHVREGQLCYQALMGRQSQCESCPARNIRQDKTCARFINNEHLDRKVLAEATAITWGGEDACLLTCREIRD